MKQKNKHFLAVTAASVAMLGLTACGGGGGGDAAPVAPAVTTTTFSGTAATGAALANATVSISCASGTGTTTTSATGSYSKDIASVTLPCALRAASTDGTTVLYSVTTATATSSSTQVANITPLTQLVVASLTGAEPATFFNNFNATTAAAVTPTSVAAAQTAVLNTLTQAGVNTAGVTDLIGSALTAGSHTGYDGVLDAVQTQLAASGTTLATLTTTVAAASPSASNTTTATANTPSLPAAQLLKTADSNCSALRSGDYWAITPTKGLGMANQFTSGSYNASTKAATNLLGGSTVLSNNGACQYLAADGVSDVVVSQAGIAVTRYRDGGSVYRLGLAIPKQTIAVADLAGTWSSLNFEMNDAGTGYVGATASATVSSAGVLSSVVGCNGAVAASTCTASTDAMSFQANSDGALDLVDTTDHTTSRAFAYRAGSGSLVVVVVDGDGSLTFFTKQRTLGLPTVGTVNPKSWSVRTSNLLVANPLAISYTTTVTGVDATAGSYTRTQNTATGVADYSETILINNPRNGYNFRAAANGVASSVSGTTNIRERTSLGLPGTGLSVQSIPSLTAFQVSIDQP